MTDHLLELANAIADLPDELKDFSLEDMRQTTEGYELYFEYWVGAKTYKYKVVVAEVS